MNTLINKSLLLNYKTNRKCDVCKEFIFLEDYIFEENVQVIRLDKKSYHKDCLAEIFESKRKYKGLNFDTFWNENIDKSTLVFWNIVAKNHLYKYVVEHYNITYITNAFYQKMEQIYNGKWKNVSKCVRPEHILDMFRQKQSWLDRGVEWKKLKGMEAYNYALAVILNQYDSYLSWMEKSRIEKQEIEANKSLGNEINYAVFNTKKRKENPIFEEE